MTETLTSLSESQLKKIKFLVEKAEMNFESDNENKCSIYNFYAQRYGIIIINDWASDNDNEFKVIDSKSKAAIVGKDLDVKIAEILQEFTKAKRTIEHTKTNNDGKIHTITSTSYVHPNAKLLEAILKEAKVEIPLNIRVELARRFMQEAQAELKELTLEQQLEQVIRHEIYLKVCNDLVAEGFKVKNKKAHAKLEEAHSSAQIKAHKSKPKIKKAQEPKMSKQDSGILKMLDKNASKEQIEAKRKALLAILNDSSENDSQENESESSESKKFNISTTSIKEQTFGS